MRPIYLIAKEIVADWSKTPGGISAFAKPYLSAMLQLNSIEDDFGMDSARSVVLYFLSNATSWRGETARRIKAELKELTKKKGK